MQYPLYTLVMNYKIIDFHTHPFFYERDNICNHKDVIKMNADFTAKLMKKHEVSVFCGSVICVEPLKDGETRLSRMLRNNDSALFLRDYYKGAYIPGFHIHPDYPDESVKEIDRMKKEGVKLIGELVPYIDGYKINGLNFHDLVDYATKQDMIISLHTDSAYDDDTDELVKRHPDAKIIAAHPGELNKFLRHVDRAKLSDNYYLDLSGTGIFRYGLLRHAIDAMGLERIIYGSDYPTCNPSVFLGGVKDDELLTEKEKQAVLAGNAARLLGIK